MKTKKKILAHHARAFEDAIISWKAPEYAHHEKSLTWFVVAGLIALGFVIYGLVTDGWTFSVAVIVLCGTYYLSHRTKPHVVDIKISKIGIKIGRHMFPYTHIRHFWIVYDPPFVQKLYFRMESRVHPDIFVSLENADMPEVRRVLSEYLTEMKGASEPFSDTLIRLFKL